MRTLDEMDCLWLRKRTPKVVLDAMRKHAGKVVCAGGFIRSCIANEDVNDIDLFVPDKEFGLTLANSLLSDSRRKLITTDNAYTILGPHAPIQVIHRWTFDSPEKVVESFDFTIARGAFWYSAAPEAISPFFESLCADNFYSDLAAKRLVYTCPNRNEDAGGSMLRVLKFYQRGYRIPLDSLGRVMARLDRAIKRTGDDSEEYIAKIITGLLREVDPALDPDHTAHLPSVGDTA